MAFVSFSGGGALVRESWVGARGAPLAPGGGRWAFGSGCEDGGLAGSWFRGVADWRCGLVVGGLRQLRRKVWEVAQLGCLCTCMPGQGLGSVGRTALWAAAWSSAESSQDFSGACPNFLLCGRMKTARQ